MPIAGHTVDKGSGQLRGVGAGQLVDGYVTVALAVEPRGVIGRSENITVAGPGIEPGVP